MSEPTLAPLSPSERDLFTRASTSPMDVIQGEVKTYIDRMIEFSRKTAVWGLPVGSPLIILKDLTAQTAEYVYQDAAGVNYLYCNGVAVSQTTYADLYAFFGASAFAADSGGNFTLPDCRGRSLFFCGTNAAADLGDNDGVAEASRQAKHAPTASLTVTGAPGVGTLGVGNGTLGPKVSLVAAAGSTAMGVDSAAAASADHFGGAATITGAPTVGTLAVGGTVGSGMTGDGPAHLYIGSLLVRF